METGRGSRHHEPLATRAIVRSRLAISFPSSFPRGMSPLQSQLLNRARCDARLLKKLLLGGGRTRIDILPLGRFDFGPLAAVETVTEYQHSLLAGRLALAFAALGGRVLGRLQLPEHSPLSFLHRGHIHELGVFEIDVSLARRLLFALLAEIAVGLARDSVAQRLL